MALAQGSGLCACNRPTRYWFPTIHNSFAPSWNQHCRRNGISTSPFSTTCSPLHALCRWSAGPPSA